MIRNEILSKDYNPNIITYLWQSKQISAQEFKILKNKYTLNY